jgi:tRNA A-37 threonylcarbamoyl transferase component Bud32
VKIPRADGGIVTIYPGSVQKELKALKSGDLKKLQALYDNIAQSKYLIHLEDKIISIKAKTMLRLALVGDPNARPRILEDLENATHDMLHGLADLHKAGYAHRDLRWENCIKVNVRSDWKWVIIDLELAGPDAGTLEDRNGKKIYTKGSDIYQLGKLIVEWLDGCKGGEDEKEMRVLGEKMQEERGEASKILGDICKKHYQRCRKFDS